MVGILLNDNYKTSKESLKKKLSKLNIDTRDFFKSIANQPCFEKLISNKNPATASTKNNIISNNSFSICNDPPIKAKGTDPNK